MPYLAPATKEELHCLQVAPQGCLVEGGVPVHPRLLHLRLLCQQESEHGGVAAGGGVVHGRPHVGVAGVDGDAAGGEDLRLVEGGGGGAGEWERRV